MEINFSIWQNQPNDKGDYERRNEITLKKY